MLLHPHAALQRLLRRVRVLGAQKIPLKDSDGRVLSSDVRAVEDSPAFAVSMMDGFAVQASATKKCPFVFKVTSRVYAGDRPGRGVTDSACAAIATGAMLPPGADAVVMKEDARLCRQDRVEIRRPVRAGQHVYRQAAFFKKGDWLLRRGQRLDARHAGLLASQGFDRVPVYRKPRVALLSTGHEVVTPGARKSAGQIWNSSASVVECGISGMGLRVKDLGICPDDPVLLRRRIRQGLAFDVLILTGAVSVGDRDFVPGALQSLGCCVVFHGLNMRPGKPLLSAVKDRCLIFGLPGNPVSCFMGFLLFIKPALNALSGYRRELVMEKGILRERVVNDSGRVSFLPCRLENKKRLWNVFPLPYRGSADLQTLAGCDGFFEVGAGQKRLGCGRSVRFLRLD